MEFICDVRKWMIEETINISSLPIIVMMLLFLHVYLVLIVFNKIEYYQTNYLHCIKRNGLRTRDIL